MVRCTAVPPPWMVAPVTVGAVPLAALITKLLVLVASPASTFSLNCTTRPVGLFGITEMTLGAEVSASGVNGV